MAAGKVRLTGTSTEFLVRHFRGEEALGTPFRFELELLTVSRNVKIADLIGQPWTLEIDLPQDKKRYFHGHVANMLSTGPIGRFASYHVTLRPTLWFLSLASNCRIFPRMSVLDIVRELTDKRGVMLDTEGVHPSAYKEQRYTVQYRETELALLSRLMEHEGMYYFFKHEAGSHTMMLADAPGSHKDAFPGYAEVPFHYATDAHQIDGIDQWLYGASAQTKKHTLNDFDFKKPDAEILAKLEASAADESESQDYERFDFPGAFFDADRGQDLVAVRQQEALAHAGVARGSGAVRGIAPGYWFKLKYAPPGQDGEYLVTQAGYDCAPGDYEASDGAQDESFFRCTFTAIKKATHYRPVRSTPKPVISGLQTAKVIGPKGREIWTDSAGRIRIRFHWQRPEEDAAREEASAIWVRVAQVMAGKGWGALQIPRIGHEVVVSFLEGDPDRPIVTGCVYNEANKPPFNPGAGGMVLGMKSDSTPGGGGYNELSLDDTKGNELINLHGQFDMASVIEHDKRLRVGNHRSSEIGGNDTEHVVGFQQVDIDNDQKVTVKLNQITQVQMAHMLDVTAASIETVGAVKALSVGTKGAAAYNIMVTGTMSEKVSKGLIQEIGADKGVTVTGNATEQVHGNKSVTVTKDKTLTAKNITATAGDNVTIAASSMDMKLTAKANWTASGRNGLIELTDQLTLKVGAASITMNKDGAIEIRGKGITIDAGSKDLTLKGKNIKQNP